MAAAILTHPAEILRTPADHVTDFDQALQIDAVQVVLAHRQAGGLGLAAPQIGISKRICVWRSPHGDMLLINPTLAYETGAVADIEGCLSIPGRVFMVRRPAMVGVDAQDLAGNRHRIEALGVHARILCHELDHLDGILVVDRALSQA